MIWTNKADFKRWREIQNDEGTVYNDYEPTLTEVDCNLQEDDGYSNYGPYGRTDEDFTYTLFVPKHFQPYISEMDVVIIDSGERYRVEKIFRNYVTHLELLLKSGVNSG